MDAPRYAQIEPVGQCNLRCRMCAVQFRQDGPPHGPLAFMDYDVYCRLVDGLAGTRELHLQGLGEPLMHPRFFDMVAYAAQRGMCVSTNTNLTLLSKRRAERLVASGIDQIHVSVDGASAATYEHIRVRARFARLRRNLDYLAAACDLKPRPRLRLVTVAQRGNLHELPALVDLACEYGIDEMFVQHLCHDFGEDTLPAHYAPMRAFVAEQTLLGESRERVEHYFGVARERAVQRGVELRLPRVTVHRHAFGTPGRQRCDWPWRGPYISYRGEAMPCCMVGTPDRITLGDMAREGVHSVWHGNAYVKFRTALGSATPPAVCRSCALYQGTF